MKIRKPGPLGRWMVVYMGMNLTLWVAFSLLFAEDVVQSVLDNHITLFALTCAAISLLVTTIVDDVLDGTEDEEGQA